MKTKYIAFGNMKGGVGKTTLNSILANYIKNNTDKSVVVLDADDSQLSLTKLREMDEKFNDEFESYPLIEVSSKDVTTFARENLESEVDYVIIDLPGNVNQEGVIETYSILDYLFVPTRLTVLDIQSSVEFITNSVTKINNIRKELDFPEMVVTGCINNVDKRTTEYNQYKEIGSSYVTDLVPFIKTVLPSSSVFSREINTKDEFKHKTKGDLIKHFCKEVFEIINQN